MGSSLSHHSGVSDVRGYTGSANTDKQYADGIMNGTALNCLVHS